MLTIDSKRCAVGIDGDLVDKEAFHFSNGPIDSLEIAVPGRSIWICFFDLEVVVVILGRTRFGFVLNHCNVG